MDRNQNVRIAASNITASGISLSREAALRPDMLLSGLAPAEDGTLQHFYDLYPFVDLVTEMRWSDMALVRSATCGPLSCLVIEGPKVADTQVLMIIPLAPTNLNDKHFDLGASRLRDELAQRIKSREIQCMDGDLRWITGSD